MLNVFGQMNFHPDDGDILDLDFKMSSALAPPSPDAEARSICPLLATPSPTTEIEHPLAVHQLAAQGKCCGFSYSFWDFVESTIQPGYAAIV